MPGPVPRAAGDRHLANLVGLVSLDVMTRVAGAIEAATGLSMVQATALSALANYAEGGSVDQLRRAVGLSHSATVRLVDRLVERGLVQRRPAATDQRVAAVHMTASGQCTVGTIRTARLDVLQQWIARLSAEQREVLSAVLDDAAPGALGEAPAGVVKADYLCRLCAPDACGHPDRCPVTRAV